MNSRGQAFSVFQLLIAAVVAGAILVILLQVLGTLPGISQDPNEVAGSSVQTQIDNIGSPAFKKVTFENGSNLTAKTIAAKSSAIPPEKVCVGVSEDVPNAEADFQVNSSNSSVIYKGTFNQKARILVYCDNSRDLAEGINEFEYDFALPEIGCDFGDSTTKACVIIVVPDV